MPNNNKSLFLVFLITLALIGIFSYLIEKPLSTYLKKLQSNPIETAVPTKPVILDSLIVGKEYEVCSEKTDDPFEPQVRHKVVIISMKNGYVQYYDMNYSHDIYFSRTESMFREIMNDCK